MAGSAQCNVVTATEDTARVNGRCRKYSLFIPDGVTQGKQVPAILFLHGFTRSRHKHRGLAMRLCRSLNLIVLTPDSPAMVLPALIGQAERAQARCINEAVSFTGWLRDLPYVDPAAVLLGGFSAGGAAALSATVELQRTGAPPLGLLLLDAVPWPRTVADASVLQPLKGGCLLVESEPSSFNSHLAFRNEVLPALPSEWRWPGGEGDIATGRISVIRVPGSAHIDVEDGEHHDSFLGRLAWGEPRASMTQQFQDLAEEFVAEALESTPCASQSTPASNHHRVVKKNGEVAVRACSEDAAAAAAAA
eukprot:CAMPEP_0172871534 /NCGR_PEP_ID=MMETSP1075-20121228/92143_1 /TAXON_ID=2916 /ORGANISM="Ceratium fusus, Strain PA161109" /LENGTH=305 /DNA_ID=CAMNT_0013721791 /DNA_START=14 /DNA_END=928 /DNA_ORIENTATION=+